MREIEKIKKFVEENQNDLFSFVDGKKWWTSSAKVILDGDELLVYEDHHGSLLGNKEIVRVKESDFQLPQKETLEKRIVKYLSYSEDIAEESYICRYWSIRSSKTNNKTFKWLVVGTLTIEDYIKAVEISDNKSTILEEIKKVELKKEQAKILEEKRKLQEKRNGKQEFVKPTKKEYNKKKQLNHATNKKPKIT